MVKAKKVERGATVGYNCSQATKKLRLLEKQEATLTKQVQQLEKNLEKLQAKLDDTSDQIDSLEMEMQDNGCFDPPDEE